MKIAHIADVHIRFSSRKEEFKQVFKNLEKSLLEEKPDRIVVVGDIMHNKLNMSPSSFTSMVEFLFMLAKIAPTDIFPGNHDANLKQLEQGDAIRPIFEVSKLLEKEKSAIIVTDENKVNINYWNNSIYYFQKSGFYEIGQNTIYGVYSCLDGEIIRIDKREPEKTYVGFFHGPIYGGRMDNGYECKDESAVKISTFKNFHAVMLGDFHEHQAFENWQDKFISEKETELYESLGWIITDDKNEDEKIRIRKKVENIAYCGSLVQNSFGESIDKGYLIWDINGEDVSFRRKLVLNDYGFQKIIISRGENVEERILNMRMSNNPKKTKALIVLEDFEENKSTEKENQIVNFVKSKFGCEFIRVDWQFIERDIESMNLDESEYDENSFEDIFEYYIDTVEHDLKDDEIAELKTFAYKTEKELGLINSQLISRKYDLVSVEVRNVFSFPDRPVTFNFENLQGITGIFGENFCGKSNVIKAIVWGLYDEIIGTKNKKKLINIYTNSAKGYVRSVIRINDVLYRITREVIKTKKSNSYPIKFEIYDSIKEEWTDEISDERTGEAGEIKNLVLNSIGDYDDCAKIALHISGSSDDYLSLKQQPKNDLIGRYLGLLEYRTRHEYVKKMFNELLAKQKNYRKIDEVELSITENQSKLSALETEQKSNEEEKVLLETKMNDKNNKIINLSRDIGKIENIGFQSKTEIERKLEDAEISKENLLKEKENASSWINSNPKKEIDVNTSKTVDELASEITNLKASIEKFVQAEERGRAWFIENVIKETKDTAEKESALKSLYEKIVEEQNKIIAFKGNACPTCKTVLEAANPEKEHECINIIEKYQKEVEEIKNFLQVQKDIKEKNNEITKKKSEFDALISNIENKKTQLAQLEDTKSRLEKVQDFIKHNNEYTKKASELHIILNKIDEKNAEIQKLTQAKEKFDQNEKTKKQNEILEQQISELKSENFESQQLLNSILLTLKRVFAEIRVLTQNIEIDKKELSELKEYDKKYKKLSFYLQAVHRDGIPAMVIRKKLPVINTKINSILHGIVNFKVDLEINEDGDISEVFYFSPEKWDSLPIEQASGSQKFISSLAIKHALYYISKSSSAQPTFIMIDEGFGTLDDSLVADIPNLLLYLKTKYKNVIIITHLNEIKDCTDNVIEVTKDRSSLTTEVLSENKEAGVSSFHFTKK